MWVTLGYINLLILLCQIWEFVTHICHKIVLLSVVWSNRIISIVKGSYFNQCDHFESLLNEFWPISVISYVHCDSFLSHIKVSEESYNVYISWALTNSNDSLWFKQIRCAQFESHARRMHIKWVYLTAISKRWLKKVTKIA